MKKEDLEKVLAEEAEKRRFMSDRDLLVRIDERQIAAGLRANNHGDRILRIELAIVGALASIAFACRDALLSLIGAKGHP